MTDLFSVARVPSRADSSVPMSSVSSTSVPLSREQVVDQILTINHSATADYLAQFAEPQLNKYLDHLLNAQEPRGRHARWDRPGDAPAIMTRRRAS